MKYALVIWGLTIQGQYIGQAPVQHFDSIEDCRAELDTEVTRISRTRDMGNLVWLKAECIKAGIET